MKYRISKYNPNYRNNLGHYQKSDWTSITDIGKSYDGIILSEKVYSQIENVYVKTILEISLYFGVEYFYIIGLETVNGMSNDTRFPELYDGKLKTFYENLSDGQRYNIDSLDYILRLILREDIWAQLVISTPEIRFSFGYDYYAYISVEFNDPKLQEQLEKHGLFVENIN